MKLVTNVSEEFASPNFRAEILNMRAVNIMYHGLESSMFVSASKSFPQIFPGAFLYLYLLDL